MTTKTTKKEMFELGKAHALAGKQCTPYDCQEIDKRLFAESKAHPRPAKWYADMRGAFNKGWDWQHVEMLRAEGVLMR